MSQAEHHAISPFLCSCVSMAGGPHLTSSSPLLTSLSRSTRRRNSTCRFFVRSLDSLSLLPCSLSQAPFRAHQRPCPRQETELPTPRDARTRPPSPPGRALPAAARSVPAPARRTAPRPPDTEPPNRVPEQRPAPVTRPDRSRARQPSSARSFRVNEALRQPFPSPLTLQLLAPFVAD
jgi:hypothetical protein